MVLVVVRGCRGGCDGQQQNVEFFEESDPALRDLTASRVAEQPRAVALDRSPQRGGSVAAGDLSEVLTDLPVGAAPDIVHVVPEMALSASYRPLISPLRAMGVPKASRNAWYLDTDTSKYKRLTAAVRAEILDALAHYEGSVVLVSHDPGAVEALNPERVLIMPDGTEDHWSREYQELIELA